MIEDPRASKVCGAGLADGQRQWRQVQEADHGAGPQAKRSPKERSAVPGTVTMVSQVALDGLGVVTPPDRSMAAARLGQQDRSGHGDRPRSRKARGWSSYVLTTTLSTSKSLEYTIG